MPGVRANRGAAGAGRHLRQYSDIGLRLEVMRSSVQVYCLWRELFGAETLPGGSSVWELERRFVGKVDAELFPVDTWVFDQIMYGYDEEDPFNMPIPVAGLRMPWEACAGIDLPEWQELLGRCIQVFHVDGDQGWDEDITADLETPYIEWLSGDGMEEALARLAEIGAPWDGVAELIRVSTGEVTGNPFLDWPDDAQWSYEYAYCDFYWTAKDMRRLAGMYDQVRERAGRIEGFRRWFNDLGGELANQMIVERLEEAGQPQGGYPQGVPLRGDGDDG